MAISTKAATEEKIQKLGDELLEGISGGYIFDASVLNAPNSINASPWQVIDKKGNVVKRCETEEDARKYAMAHGYTTDVLNWDQLQKLRKTGRPY